LLWVLFNLSRPPLWRLIPLILLFYVPLRIRFSAGFSVFDFSSICGLNFSLKFEVALFDFSLPSLLRLPDVFDPFLPRVPPLITFLSFFSARCLLARVFSVFRFARDAAQFFQFQCLNPFLGVRFHGRFLAISPSIFLFLRCLSLYNHMRTNCGTLPPLPPSEFGSAIFSISSPSPRGPVPQNRSQSRHRPPRDHS